MIRYGAWSWFGGRTVTFSWEHEYGPLDWPRRGTTLLEVESRRPLYWKVETLDRFDGLRWTRSRDNNSIPSGAEMPPDPDERWERRFEVTVRALESDFVVVAGTPLRAARAPVPTFRWRRTGPSAASRSRCAAATATGCARTCPIRRRRRCARSPADYPVSFAQYTRIALPRAGETAIDDARGTGLGRPEVSVPLRGDGSAADLQATAGELRASPYARVYDLSQRLTANATTTYDAVAAVRSYLRDNYTYSERPPSADYPLEAFLFEDKIGYCQQFSGAMALLLRMAGIPARVSAGFSPGSRNRDAGEYRVRDLDAHSWVEVYFTGIGWVTFDPTPSGAPAERSGTLADPAPISSPGDSADRADRPDAATGGGAGADAGESGSGGGMGFLGWLAVGAALLGATAGGVALRARRARRDLGPQELAGAGLRELERALPRLGIAVPPDATLLSLEKRVGRAAGPVAAGYVADLRRARFGPPTRRGIRPAGRHALRRGLTAARGPFVWLQGLVLLPPWGPRPRRPLMKS